MKKSAKLALLAACILVGLLIVGCSDAEPAVSDDEGEQLASSFISGKTINASFTDDRAAGMKGVAETNELRLFVDDQTGAVAVLHKQSGEMWHSNPIDRDTDTVAAGTNKGALSAQLKIDFYNSFGQLNSVNSYTDSVAYKQISVESIANGAKVSYMFGTSKKTMDDMPMKISKERFEEKVLAKLDNAGQRALKIAYSEDDKTGLYVRIDGALKGIQLDRALKAFEDAGYTEEDLLQDIAENNLSQTKPEARVFLAVIEYTLDGESLVAKMPLKDIRFPKDYPVNTVSLLTYFGAGGSEEKGSMFVPDGSGALIHFNNGKIRYPAYQQSVYGGDQTIERVENVASTQDVRLPVFGIIREKGGFLGIIEEGDSAATISADISGRLNSYNYVYPTFTVLNKGDLTLFANNQQRSLPRFQENPTKTDFSVRYMFLGEENASYQGMASAYQQYLIRNNGLPEQMADKAETEDMPFYLELIGSIDKQKHFAGIPYRALEPLTTFDQAQTIVSAMQQQGINNIKLKYSGWFNEGLDHKVPDGIKVDGVVGGKSGMKDFVAFANNTGVSLFPDVSLLTARTDEGFNDTKEASRTLRGVPAEVYPLDLALNRRDRTKSPAYVVSPRLVGSYVDAMLKDFGKYGTDGISLRDLADKLNSDFRKNEQIDRAESKDVSVQALESIYGESLKIMADGGNAYALPYLTDITYAPMANSKFKIEDESVPFYQMVVRGFVDYTGAPYNLSSYTDVKQYMLKTLEYGAGVYFEWIYEPNHKVKDTEYTNLYAVNYELWLDQATDVYKEINAFLQNVRHDRIVGHEKLQEGVYKTVYESGYVIVNYNRSAVTVEGKTIEAEGYVTGGGKS